MTGAVGVTGSRFGMNDLQRLNFVDLWTRLRPTELHHGDCVGVDQQVHDLVRAIDPRAVVVGHPPDVDAARAFCECDAYRPPRPYLDRDHDVVDEVEALLALPATEVELLRSGTWATVRYAAKVGRPTFVLWPSGRVEVRNDL